MPGVLRILVGRGIWAGVAGLVLATPVIAQPPEDPIAASNRLMDPWVAPGARSPALDAPWLVPTSDAKPMPANASGKALLDRITSHPLTEAAPTAAPIPNSLGMLMPVVWSAPAHQPITPIMPTANRPMIPCEPAVAAPTTAPPMDPPLPPPRVLTPEGGEPQSATPPAPRTQQPVMTTATATDDPPQRTITTVRFLDDPPPPPPATDDNAVMAVIRRGGVATGSAADIRAAVERACRGRVVTCQTEVAGERQVRVVLSVHTDTDWQRLYDRMQGLPELGEYGLLFQVHIEK